MDVTSLEGETETGTVPGGDQMEGLEEQLGKLTLHTTSEAKMKTLLESAQTLTAKENIILTLR